MTLDCRDPLSVDPVEDCIHLLLVSQSKSTIVRVRKTLTEDPEQPKYSGRDERK
jgi:hypothetical protein